MSNNELEISTGGVSYKVSELSQEAQQQVANLRFVESEMARLNAQLAIYETARGTYKSVLKDLLPKTAQ
ncbi:MULTISPECIES: DUF6447 family protein [Massilia]|uniref:Uncharacterized protein n=1 Tax=Massilia violaceinigra TaxID=2045208 RepID=A0A2D2DK72_9BURK|nr:MULTISPECIES: DUF6447 family protein [Massilia]ATQ75384.1 hypothetical protein CR152_13295 [Massilia violaceinigra]MDQ1817524.1 DUF6447 family protein [Massilia sp. CCM 9210]MDQ1829524.1 DUF6447 family protein [Massilia sp. CCM 9029]MDQ1924463.1 DUF6447 family protein [Massilia sp. CCM 9206]